jgi:hypothetical protein
MRKIKQITRSEVISIPIPEKTDSYSPIENDFLISSVIEECKNRNYEVIKEEYEAASNGMQVKMNFFIQPEVGNNGFQICVLNSYNKTIAARMCGGIFAHICWNLNYVGEITDYRKHTGDAKEDVQDFIVKVFNNQQNKFINAQMLENAMKVVLLSKREQAELAGRLLIEEELLAINQLSIIQKQIKAPEFKYDFNPDSLWGLYNHTTHAIKLEHPTTFLQTQQGVQSFFVEQYQDMTQNKLILV